MYKVAMKILVLILSLSCLICYVSSEMEGFVVGGDSTNIKKYPHSAFLWIMCHIESDVVGWTCGSSIVNQNILLTAAHCFYTCRPDSEIVVGVGHTNKKQALIHHAMSFIIHERFDPNDLINDIAIVKLNKKLQFGPNVRRVAILKRSMHVDGVQMAGWGMINEEAEVTTAILKEAKQKIWPRSKCISLFKKMPDGTICAVSGYTSDTKKYGYAAQGDSGSGLIAEGYILVGLVSYKNPSYSKSVVVYTDPVYHYDWIMKTASKLYCNSKRVRIRTG